MDDSYLGIVNWAEIMTGSVDTLIIGAYWAVPHKANSPESCGALGHRIQQYLNNSWRNQLPLSL